MKRMFKSMRKSDCEVSPPLFGHPLDVYIIVGIDVVSD